MNTLSKALKFESPEWIEERNRKLDLWLLGDYDAIKFIQDIGSVMETWDDLIDKDKPVSDALIHHVFITLLISLPSNDFFAKNKNFLIPIIMLAINSWLDSNNLEKEEFEQRTYALTLRHIGIQIVPMCAFLVGGFEHSRKYSTDIWKFFTEHESAEEWINNKIK